ncbi:MAG: pyruvate kinase [Candidatus Heimdallarchaeota archaeon]|nr:MAG: pyruvate kinase [Candidatus Heimdallarchaeota archaeon]
MKNEEFTKTKIVCTIGPASENVGTLKKLTKTGMDVCRLNFSHGSHGDHLERYERIRAASADLAVLVDLCGPKIRTGDVEEGTRIENGQIFRISKEIGLEGNSEICSTNYPPLIDDAQVGNHLAIDDGLLQLRVTKKSKDELICKVLNGGLLKSRKGINAPDVPLSLYFPLPKDLEDIRFVTRKMDVEYIAASFVRRKEDILAIKEILDEKHSPIHIISKIENRDGLNNFDEILAVSDGIMVARGDLGIEIPSEQVPIVQKALIKKCNAAGKPVIVATQMLESMTYNPRPTRAEVSDVSNAIIDGADAVMLSGETAVGKFPVETVDYMERILKEININHHLLSERRAEWSKDDPSISEVLGRATHLISDNSSLKIKAIVTSTRTGSTSRLIAKNRPERPIIAGTPYESVRRQLQLVWGVCPVQVKVTPSYDELLYEIVVTANEKGYLSSADTILVVGGSLLGFPSKTNQVQITKVEDVLLFGQQLQTTPNL